MMSAFLPNVAIRNRCPASGSRSPTSESSRRSERGQSLVEFALVLPILVLTLAAMVDLSLAFYSYAGIGNAVRQGVRYGSIWTNSNDDTSIRNYTVASTGPAIALVNDSSHIVITTVISVSDSTNVPSGSRRSGNVLTIEARYDYAAASPFISMIAPNGAIPLVVSATAMID